MAVFESRWRTADPYHPTHKYPAVGSPERPLGGYDEDKRRWDDGDPVPESVRQMQAVIASLGLRIRVLPDGAAEAIETATGRVKYTWRHVTELIEQIRKNEMETSNGKHESGVPGVRWHINAWYVAPYHPEAQKAVYVGVFLFDQLDLAKQACDEARRTSLKSIPALREKYLALRGGKRSAARKVQKPERSVSRETRLVHVAAGLLAPKLEVAQAAPTADIHTLLDRALAASAAYHQAEATLRRAKTDFAAAWGEYMAALAKLGVVAAAFDEIEMDG